MSTRRSFRSVLILAILIPVAIIALHWIGVLRPIEEFVSRTAFTIGRPVFNVLLKRDIQEHQEETGNSEITLEQMSSLESEIDRLTIENAKLATLVEQTQLLQDQIDFLRTQSLTGVSARVVSASTDPITQTMIINRGVQEGVQEGYPVITAEGVLVGIISKTTEHTAHVRMITSIDSRVSAQAQNEQNSPGIARGEHNIALTLEFVPQLDTLENGQSVITSGTDEFIPKGLVIGRITEVNKQPGVLFQEAVLRPLYTFESIQLVTVIVP